MMGDALAMAVMQARGFNRRFCRLIRQARWAHACSIKCII
jgi:hypothetical protein